MSILLILFYFCLIITLFSLQCTQSVKARDRKRQKNCRAYRILKMCTAAVHVDTALRETPHPLSMQLIAPGYSYAEGGSSLLYAY